AVFAFALSFNTSVITDSNISLAELVNINNANAEDDYENGDGASGFLGEAVMHSVCHTVTVGGGPVPGSYSYQDCHDEWQCDGWFGWCY
ncbi:hypothetical protein FHR24_003135, partial [Wenyingzhuangia heitensis]